MYLFSTLICDRFFTMFSHFGSILGGPRASKNGPKIEKKRSGTPMGGTLDVLSLQWSILMGSKTLCGWIWEGSWEGLGWVLDGFGAPWTPLGWCLTFFLEGFAPKGATGTPALPRYAPRSVTIRGGSHTPTRVRFEVSWWFLLLELKWVVCSSFTHVRAPKGA